MGYIIGSESILEDFIVNNWNPSQFFGEEFANLVLLQDEEENTISFQAHLVTPFRCLDSNAKARFFIELELGLTCSYGLELIPIKGADLDFKGFWVNRFEEHRA